MLRSRPVVVEVKAIPLGTDREANVFPCLLKVV